VLIRHLVVVYLWQPNKSATGLIEHHGSGVARKLSVGLGYQLTIL